MTKLGLVISIALFGAIGAVLRVYLGTFVQGLVPVESNVRFPLGTLVVNVLGCLVFGIVGHLGAHASGINQFWRTVILSGLLGSFTTFSTFGFETYLLFEDASNGKLWLAAANVGCNVGLGLLAVFVGLQIGRFLLP